MATSNPSASALVASVAIRSSASAPALLNTGTRSAPISSEIRSICPANGAGAAERCALYSGYIAVRLSAARETSKQTARCVGASSRTTFTSIEVKP